MVSFFSFELALLVAASAAAAFAAKKLRQPSLVLYILTGLALGPAGASLASIITGGSFSALVSETEYISLMSELGLAFLLFLIGLEIKIEDIREILGETLTISVTQMVAVAAIFTGLSLLAGFGFLESVIIALAFMYSSTAVVVKILSDLNEVSTKPGRIDVSILLFEDVTVVLVMAVLTSLAAAGTLTPLNIGIEAVKVLLFVSVVAGAAVGSSRYLLPRFMRFASRSREAFLIHGIAWMFLFILIAQRAGLSLEVGAFFAGVSIAQLPYSTELHGKVKPLSDFFLAVFFISLGLGLATSSLLEYAGLAVGFSAAIITVKFVLYYTITSKLGFTDFNSFKASINMTQTSTFSIIFAELASNPPKGEALIGEEVVGMITIIALITMGVTSYLIYYSDRIWKRFREMPEGFESEEEGFAVIIGFDDAAEKILEELKPRYDHVKVLSDRVEDRSRVDDAEFIFGDFRHQDVRQDAGVKQASLVVSVSDRPQVNRELVDADLEGLTAVRAMSKEDREELEGLADLVIFEEEDAAEALRSKLEVKE